MTTDSPLRTRLRAALLEARRQRQADTVATVRSALSALENAEAVPADSAPAAGAVEQAPVGPGAADAPRRVLDEAEERAVLDAEIASLEEAAEVYAVAAPERAAAARAGIDVLSSLR
jgi:uncharacterized protein